MAGLTHIERIKLEKLFDMGGGYVMDFSNRTFSDFVYEAVELNIYAENYNQRGDSKANRLRSFWATEANYNVARLLSAMLEYYKNIVAPRVGWTTETEELYAAGLQIAQRLTSELGEHIQTITPNSSEEDFTKLSKGIRELITQNRPDEAIDRLHTFLTKFLQNACRTHNIAYDATKPLHSLLGEYIKAIKAKNWLQSEMSERILKYAISVLESYNAVRNNQSFAHANALLNHDESLLIFRVVSSVVGFITSLEKRNIVIAQNLTVPGGRDDDLPF